MQTHKTAGKHARTSSAVQKLASCFLYMSQSLLWRTGNSTKRPGSSRQIGSTQSDVAVPEALLVFGESRDGRNGAFGATCGVVAVLSDLACASRNKTPSGREIGLTDAWHAAMTPVAIRAVRGRFICAMRLLWSLLRLKVYWLRFLPQGDRVR